MAYIYSVQRQIMRLSSSFGYYSPIGDWEDLEQHENLDMAIQRMNEIRSKSHHPILEAYCFRVLCKDIDK